MDVNNYSENKDADNGSVSIQSSSLFLEDDWGALRAKFFNLRTKRDLSDLLDLPYSVLTYHLYISASLFRYRQFNIRKKGGGKRLISSPKTSLKIIQRKLSQALYCAYDPKPSVHGFAAGRSILTNAKAHANKRYVLNIDLLNFFPSINFGRVRGMFMGKPYLLPSEVATALAQICCHENQLPQGAPTSPIISNMICARLDSEMQKLAQKYKCMYTRYADDMTFSTTLKAFPNALAYIDSEDIKKTCAGYELIKVIQSNGFSLNEKKIRLQEKRSRQEVTGLTVNKFPNVSRKYLRNVRGMLHAWEKYGLLLAEAEFHKTFCISDQRHEFKTRPPLFKVVLRSRIEFIGMIRGKDSVIYKKLLFWYWRLSAS